MSFLSHTKRKNKEVLDTWLQGNVNGNESQEEIALILKDRNGATDSNMMSMLHGGCMVHDMSASL